MKIIISFPLNSKEAKAFIYGTMEARAKVLGSGGGAPHAYGKYLGLFADVLDDWEDWQDRMEWTQSN